VSVEDERELYKGVVKLGQTITTLLGDNFAPYPFSLLSVGMHGDAIAVVVVSTILMICDTWVRP